LLKLSKLDLINDMPPENGNIPLRSTTS
jgi:hypothetical protein